MGPYRVWKPQWMRKERRTRFTSMPCYGYVPTCWTPWPECCPPCEPPPSLAPMQPTAAPYDGAGESLPHPVEHHPIPPADSDSHAPMDDAPIDPPPAAPARPAPTEANTSSRPGSILDRVGRGVSLPPLPDAPVGSGDQRSDRPRHGPIRLSAGARQPLRGHRCVLFDSAAPVTSGARPDRLRDHIFPTLTIRTQSNNRQLVRWMVCGRNFGV